MNSDLSRAIRLAAAEPLTGPDLARIEREVELRRRRRRTLAAVITTLTVSLVVVLARPISVEPPVGGTVADPAVALLARSPNREDVALEQAFSNEVLDAGSVRRWGVTGDFQYGLATARSGTQICILKMEQTPNPSIGIVSCKSKSQFLNDRMFAIATNSAPDHLAPHAHIAVVFPDDYTTVRYDDHVVDIDRNLLVISSPPYPTEVVIQGASRQLTVALPPMPDPGEAPRSN